MAGAVVDYYLRADAPGPIVIEILDPAGKPVRRFASDDKPEAVSETELDIPTSWLRPAAAPSAKAGVHRFVWDLHYPAPPSRQRFYPLAAVPRDTPAEPRGPWVMPGEYTVRLTVNGQRHTQPLVVKMDPRVKSSIDDLSRQLALSLRACEDLRRIHSALEEVAAFRARPKGPADNSAALAREAAAIEGPPRPRSFFGPRAGTGPPTLNGLATDLASVLSLLQGADAAPTTQAVATADGLHKSAGELLARWAELKVRAAAPARGAGASR